MKPETYSALLKDLQKLQKSLVASQIAATREDAALAARMNKLHSEAEVGGRLDDFVGTAVRKSTVLFLLRTVFVRVLEDLGILEVKRIRDEWGFAAFREVAPALGLRAYFAFVFRDLAIDFPALFSPTEDELPLPSEDGCRALWQLWHHPNKDGEHYVWNEDGFESRFLGDLYQDLDADIRKRYALLQTPRFVEEYILDHTLTPALAEFDPEKLRAAGNTFRVLDPTCGSGHFLIGAFHRLADYWRDRHGLKEWEACGRALEGVWGADINPHAVDIAHFRLLLEVVARTGVKELDRIAKLAPNLRAMDSLIPWERAVKQGDLFPAKDRLDAYATPKQRRENGEFLSRDFHVVVGNPPYITPKDVRKRDDYAAFWRDACFANYSLSAPFAVRLFSLSRSAKGFVGQITANSFMKRLFGKSLVEVEFPQLDLTDVVDTSGAYIPGHGTPTVILVGRARAPQSTNVRAVLGKRGEPRRPLDASCGQVWRAIVEAPGADDDESPFVTVRLLSRRALSKHPWSLGGGASGPAMAALIKTDAPQLGSLVVEIGRSCIVGESNLFEFERPDALRLGIPPVLTHRLFRGESLRDFALDHAEALVLPNSLDTGRALPIEGLGRGLAHFWANKQVLRARVVSGSTRMEAAGKHWYEARRVSAAKFQTDLTLGFPLISTHNHVVLGRGREVFHESAPVIKLPPTATLEDHLDLLGLLNSSTLGFWMKQVFHNKGYGASGDGARTTAQDWENFYEYDSTKLQQAPITEEDREPRIALAKALDSTAQERAACLPAAMLAAGAWSPASLGADLVAAHERYLAHTRRMVALQEELDWLTYRSYGLMDAVALVTPEAIEPLAPGHRPFEIVLARKDDEADDDEKSAWWSRHGHERVSEIPEAYTPAHRARLQERIERIESDARLALLETAPYKRRWQLPDWESETKKAAESWLLDRLEDLFAPATDSAPRGPLAEPKPYRLEDVSVAWARDPRVAAAAGVWTGTGLSVDLTLVAEKLLRAQAMPDNPLRVYSEEGLRKLSEWKRVWALQDQEDAHEKAHAEAKAKGESIPKLRLVDPDDASKTLEAIPLPPKFDKADFARAEYFSIRGKLNVPRERFILFADLTPNRFGWNGWRDRERALAQVEAYTLAESDAHLPLPVPTTEDPRRCGVTYGLWESLPDVRRWGAEDEHAELQALAREACRQPRCPCPIVEAWTPIVLHAKKPTAEAKEAKAAAKRKAKSETETETAVEAEITLAERAWVADLFKEAQDLDIATVWARHQRRLTDSSEGEASSAGPSQLSIPLAANPRAVEQAGLDQARLARVLDDLVASGDVQVAGRGKKKRFQLVVRTIVVQSVGLRGK